MDRMEKGLDANGCAQSYAITDFKTFSFGSLAVHGKALYQGSNRRYWRHSGTDNPIKSYAAAKLHTPGRGKETWLTRHSDTTFPV